MKDSLVICLLGPTASGKTSLAVQLAKSLNGEIISADSRQVYRKMDIGTGKDLALFETDNEPIPYHLIDILEAGEMYNLYDFKNDCLLCLDQITSRKNVPIICGGTGMYLDAVLRDYNLQDAEVDSEFRNELANQTMESLKETFNAYRTPHNTTDTKDRERLIRAIEVARASRKMLKTKKNPYNFIVFGLKGDREKLKNRIDQRLKERFEQGLIEEVEGLMKSGVDFETMLYYGLEYKFVAQYLKNKFTFDEMFEKLRQGIHQYSKRQMTWFRRMEKNGIQIHWMDFETIDELKLKFMEQIIQSQPI